MASKIGNWGVGDCHWVRLIPATDAAPPHCIRERWTACGGHSLVDGPADELASSSLAGLCVLAQASSASSSSRSVSLTTEQARDVMGMTANGGFDLPPACGQPSPTFFPSLSCLVLSCESQRIHSLCAWTNRIPSRCGSAASLTSSSWFSCGSTLLTQFLSLLMGLC